MIRATAARSGEVTGRAHRIDKIVSLARSEERRLGEAAGSCARDLKTQTERLDELLAYRRDYTGSSDSARELASAHWKDYRDFLARLDAAIRAQRDVVNRCQQHLAMHRSRWMTKRQQLKSLEGVLERCRREESARDERHRQRVADDRGAPVSVYADRGDARR